MPASILPALPVVVVVGAAVVAGVVPTLTVVVAPRPANPELEAAMPAFMLAWIAADKTVANCFVPVFANRRPVVALVIHSCVPENWTTLVTTSPEASTEVTAGVTVKQHSGKVVCKAFVTEVVAIFAKSRSWAALGGVVKVVVIVE